MLFTDNENDFMKRTRNAGRYPNAMEFLRGMVGRQWNPSAVRRILDMLIFGHGNDDDHNHGAGACLCVV